MLHLCLLVSFITDYTLCSVWVNYWAEPDFIIIKIYTRLFSRCSSAHLTCCDWGIQLRIHRHWPILYFNTVHIFCLKYPYCSFQDVRTASQAKREHNIKEKKWRHAVDKMLPSFSETAKKCFVLIYLKWLSILLSMEDLSYQTNSILLPEA